MPEGHSVHRIAKQFQRNFVGHLVKVSSPQGRFAHGAAILNDQVMTDAWAVGKQMFVSFENEAWLRIHLGIYGAWDFSGQIELDATIAQANGRMGQTAQRGTVLDADGENSLSSIGAPRTTRLKMSESEQPHALSESFPPEPRGQVRVRILTETVCADLRGPTACEVLSIAEVDTVLGRLGPDPQRDASKKAGQQFVDTVLKKNTPIGLLLMDQSVVAGIGNVYRAEILYRAGIDPHTPGKKLTKEQVWQLWDDWVYLLDIGVKTGQMMTRDGLSDKEWKKAMARRAERHWTYKREGLPCRVCGTNIVLEEMANRKLYWCPTCQT
jgi:formamidopyrimidine-DNA glycosylase